MAGRLRLASHGVCFGHCLQERSRGRGLQRPPVPATGDAARDLRLGVAGAVSFSRCRIRAVSVSLWANVS